MVWYREPGKVLVSSDQRFFSVKTIRPLNYIAGITDCRSTLDYWTSRNLLPFPWENIRQYTRRIKIFFTWLDLTGGTSYKYQFGIKKTPFSLSVDGLKRIKSERNRTWYGISIKHICSFRAIRMLYLEGNAYIHTISD